MTTSPDTVGVESGHRAEHAHASPVTRTSRVTLPHSPALDGLRGVAVAGVVAYHLGHLRGGYLGVDLFFVLSGFLITSLLVVEQERTGRISLATFWTRRVRRLLPALLVLLVVVAIVSWSTADPTELDRLRGEGLAALFYVANWHSILDGSSYWDNLLSPSPLDHVWSLAIEEQFYVVWPLLVWLLSCRWRVSLRGLGVLAGLGAIASAVAMALVWEEGSSRAYEGTDTRAAALLLGAVVAAVLVRRPDPLDSRTARPGLVLAGGLGCVVFLGFAWATVEGSDELLYRGGFLLASAAAAGLIGAVWTDPDGPLGRVLSLPVLRWLGTRSYGIYLWHWPMIAWITTGSIGASSGVVLVARVLASAAAAEVSYRLVEMPIRRGAIRDASLRWVVPVAMAAVAALLLVATSGGSSEAGTDASAPIELPELGGADASPDASTTTAAATVPTTDAVTGAGVPTTTTVAPRTGPLRVLVVGDSGAAYLGEALEALESPDLVVAKGGVIACTVANEGEGLLLEDGRILPDVPGCEDWPSRWAAARDEMGADVGLLVLAWPGYGDRLVEGEWRHPCDPVFDAYYLREVSSALAVLGEGHSHAVVATSPPWIGEEAEPDADERMGCIEAVVRRAAEEEGAAVLDLATFACPAGECLTEIDGVELRPDGLHFTEEGAELEAAWVREQLLTLFPGG